MNKPILLIDFGQIMLDRLNDMSNFEKTTLILDKYVVEAIPIEWIKKWEQKEENYYLYKDLTKKLLEDWKNEHV